MFSSKNSLKIAKIIRTSRKTVALQIKPDGCLIVRAPFFVSKTRLNRVIFEKRFWILKKKELIERKNKAIVKKEFIPGEEFLYLGQKYKLYLSEIKKPNLILNNGFFLSKYYLGSREGLFTSWYRENAYEKLKQRVNFYVSAGEASYNKINITSAQYRWGSCSSRGNLNFSWRLIMAPLEIIDYVVVHEIAHLRERNHSKSFWNIVKIMYPNYQKSRKWLKDNGHLLVMQPQKPA
ncbi:MAG: SprT family zinc-dependent metalloprotease [Candidatus Omnitrophota bacterium]